MGLLHRLFSNTYRRALAAEAAGDYEEAAQLFAQCEERAKVAEMHLCRARTDTDPQRSLQLLQTATEFAPSGSELERRVHALLGQAHLQQAEQSDPHTAEGREHLRRAARSYGRAGNDERAGECWLAVGELDRAISAFSAAGLVERVEQLLARQQAANDRARQEHGSFKDYELYLQGGQRDAARAALLRCIEAAEHKGEYRRLLEQLDRQLLSDNHVVMEVGGQTLTLCGPGPVVIGRDAACQLQVRGAAISRRHAQVEPTSQGYLVRDLGSHNGTRLNGLPISGAIPLPPGGVLGLGDDCTVEVELHGDPPHSVALTVTGALDHGKLLVASDKPHQLAGLLQGGPALFIRFEQGRPMAEGDGLVELGGLRLAGPVQLIRGDLLAVGNQSLRVLD